MANTIAGRTPAAQETDREAGQRHGQGPIPSTAIWSGPSGRSSSPCSASAPRSAPASSSCSPRRCRRPGPASSLSFVIAGIVAALTALCYAEMASTIPVSGSSYSYAYATLGEIIAYFVGWCLLLEYGISAAAVAVGWGSYLNKMLDRASVRLPRHAAARSGDGSPGGGEAISICPPSSWSSCAACC